MGLGVKCRAVKKRLGPGREREKESGVKRSLDKKGLLLRGSLCPRPLATKTFWGDLTNTPPLTLLSLLERQKMRAAE